MKTGDIARKAKSLAVVAVILCILEVAYFNYRWLMHFTVGTAAVPFSLPAYRVVLYVLILLSACFFDSLKKVLATVDRTIADRIHLQNVAVPKNDRRYARWFVMLGLVFGLFFVFLIPPYNVSDEPEHFRQAYYVSEFQLFPQINSSGIPVGTVEKDENAFHQTWVTAAFHPDNKYKYSDLQAEFAKTADHTKVEGIYRFPSYPFVMYLPQGIGIFTGRVLFHLFRLSSQYNTYNQLMFARLFNLLFFLFMVYWAIRIMPVLKRVMLFVGLMPMTLFLAASCSADVYAISVCFLFVAVVFRYAFDDDIQRITGARVVGLAAVAAMLFFAKYAYIPLGLLTFLIPKEKFGNIKRKLVVIAIAAGAGVITLGLWMITLKLHTAGMRPDGYMIASGNPAELVRDQTLQLQYVLHHPLRFLGTVCADLVEKNGYLTSLSYVAQLGWADTIFPNIFIVLYTLLLVFSALTEAFSKRISIRGRALAFAAAALCILLVETSQYIYWTPYPYVTGTIGGLQVEGVMGRYFIPLFAVLLFFFVNRLTFKSRLFGKLNEAFSKAVPAIATASLSITSLIIFMRYWIP